MKRKIAAIVQTGTRPRRRPQRTAVTENEVNAYLAYDAAARYSGRRRRSVRGDSRHRVVCRPRDRRSRRGAQAEDPTSLLDPMSYLTGRLPVTATGALTDEQRRRPLRARVGERRQRAGSEVPAAGDRQLLLAHAGESGRHQPRRSVCAAGAHPRDPGRAGTSHNRAVSTSEGMPTPDLTTPLQFLKGVGPRRAADLERAGLLTIEDLLYRFPIRYEDRSRLQTDRVAEARADRASIAGRVLSCGLRSTRRPGSRSSRRRRRRHRIAARVVAQSAVSARRLRARAARRAVRPGRDARARRPAAHEPAVRNPRRRGRRDDPHRAHRAGLREDRHASRRRCSGGSCTTRCSSCRRICRIRCRKTCALRLGAAVALRGAARDALSRRRTRRSTR